MKIAVLITLAILLTSCMETGTPIEGRWYTTAQVAAGEPLYQSYCAACHASDGSATDDWRTPGADGNYPPPPLNGTAHTWHHPLEVLDDTIINGGIAFGGVMPGFGEALGEEDRYAIIAWFQSLWSEDIYASWLEIEVRSQD